MSQNQRPRQAERAQGRLTPVKFLPHLISQGIDLEHTTPEGLRRSFAQKRRARLAVAHTFGQHEHTDCYVCEQLLGDWMMGLAQPEGA